MNEQAQLPRAALASRELRRARARRVAIALAVFVGLPTILAAVYYVLVATPQYESVAVLSVDSGEPADPGGHRRAAAATDGSALQIVREHILSRSLVAKLAQDRALTRHYADRRVDWWSRLGHPAGSEKVHAYYLQKVSCNEDAKGATLTLRVRAFSARQARGLARTIVASAEQMIDRISARSRRELIGIADGRVADAERRLAEARAADPGAASDPAAAGLELELAREQMGAARRGLELAQAETARRYRTLVVVAEPSLPDEPSYPRRLWSIATIFFVSLALLGVLGLLGAAVREHAQL